MLAVDSEQFQSSLHDVVGWCATHYGTLVRDSAEATDRRNQYETANALFEEARTIAGRRWRRRSITETDQWKRAQTLWSQIGALFDSLESRLRGPSLMPSRAIDELRTDSDWFQAVSEVVSKRRERKKRDSPVEDDFAFVDLDRLLIYFPHENPADGAAEVSSNGFYDANNVPPWEIWVSFSDGALISWVPLGLIEVAQMGIDANPENCIRWLHQ